MVICVIAINFKSSALAVQAAATTKESVETLPSELALSDSESLMLESEDMDAELDESNDDVGAENSSASPPVTAPVFDKASIPPAKNSLMKKGPIVDKSSMGCMDILMGGQIYSDPSVNLVYSYVYSLCLMEWTMQKYLKSQKYTQVQDKVMVDGAEKALSEVQRILPSYLLGFVMLVNAFKQEEFRKKLDIMRQNVNAKDSGINLSLPVS